MINCRIILKWTGWMGVISVEITKKISKILSIYNDERGIWHSKSCNVLVNIYGETTKMIFCYNIFYHINICIKDKV